MGYICHVKNWCCFVLEKKKEYFPQLKQKVLRGVTFFLVFFLNSLTFICTLF